jgi:hypothetical protein
MNVALTTILIIILFLPGLVFRRAYYSEPFSYKYISNNILFDIANAIIPSFILHLIGIWCVERFTDYMVNFYVLEKLFGTIKYSAQESPFVNIGNNFGEIFTYFLGLVLLALSSGHLIRFVIIKCNLDLYLKFLHFNNEWYYLFKARYIKSKLKDLEKNNPEFGKIKIDEDLMIYLDILVESVSGVVIYKGILENFTLAKGGGLDSIRLAKVSKQKYKILSDSLSKKEKKKKKSEEQTIPGHSVVFPMHLIKNINIRYIIVKEEDSVGVQ